ncbi:MAG: hypothetical protein WCP77_11215 [Roseococcus sp.]
MTGDDVRIDADGMTIEGETFRMIEALARKLGVEPIEALRMALNSASARDEDKA